MDKLHQEAQCNNRQADGYYYEDSHDCRSAGLIETWRIWLIGHWLDLFQVEQIMMEIIHRRISLIRITTNGPHHYGSQFR